LGGKSIVVFPRRRRLRLRRAFDGVVEFMPALVTPEGVVEFLFVIRSPVHFPGDVTTGARVHGVVVRVDMYGHGYRLLT